MKRKIFSPLRDGDCTNGEGTKYDEDGQKIYEGRWKDGKPHGHGIVYKNGKKIWEGESQNGEFHGTGTLYNDKGMKAFEGEWRNGERTGRGIQYDGAGHKLYEGEFKNGKWDGAGTAFRSDGTVLYEGRFSNDEFHGEGVLYSEKGEVIHRGQFKNGVFDHQDSIEEPLQKIKSETPSAVQPTTMAQKADLKEGKTRSKVWIGIVFDLLIVALAALFFIRDAPSFPRGGIEAVLLVLLILGFVVFMAVNLAPVFRGAFGSKAFFLGNGKKAKEVLASGRPAVATVVSIGENSGGGTVTINSQPYLNLRLSIDDGSSPAYEINFDTIVRRTDVPQFQPGARFAVKIDPLDPKKVVLDPERTAGSEGAEGAMDSPVVGAETLSELDLTLLRDQGKKAEAKILAVEDTGRSDAFKPVVRITYEVHLPGESPYTAPNYIPMDTELVQRVKRLVGRTFPARVHPHDRTKLDVEVDLGV